MVKPISPPICPYCGGDAVLVTGWTISQDLSNRKYWYCAGDNAYIGAHAKTERPLGTMADPDLREARRAAHVEFDEIWQEKALRETLEPFHARGKGYRWLAEQMQIPVSEANISTMGLEQCAIVIRICRPFAQRLRMRR